MTQNSIFLFVLFVLCASCNSPSSEQNEGFQAKDTPHPQVVVDTPEASSTWVKFTPPITFDDYKTVIAQNLAKAPLAWSSHADAMRFKTKIREAYQAKAPNFAGHYIFFEWGCGSPCQSSMLIDWNTGKIYDGVNASSGYDFRADSRMLIVNPPDSTGYERNCAYCEPAIYIFNETTKRFDKYRTETP